MKITVYKSNGTILKKKEIAESLRFFSYDCVPSDQPRRSFRYEIMTDTPKPVCKQIWFETSQIFFAIATFAFHYPLDFQALMILSPMWLQHVRRLQINLFTFPVMKRWARVLSYSAVGRFTNLEGIEIRVRATWTDVEPLQGGVMTGKEWKKTKLPSIIRSLQQHKLKPELTRFICDLSCDSQGKRKQPFADAIDEAVRTELLKASPMTYVQAWQA
jgi:hypothetical protein